MELTGTDERRRDAGSDSFQRSPLARLGRYWPLLPLLLLPALAFESARFLVIDNPKAADVILVLAGETNVRPARALRLASEGYARRIVVNVPDWTTLYGHSELDLARDWAKSQTFPITICPIHGLSTKEETRDIRKCLYELKVHSVLIVTSEFHTRRALSTLRRELPDHDFAVAAAYDSKEFGVNWWQRRQWTKTTFYEWTRLVWWGLVDRWF
jgi:uncharacterized SAM-binding protein YcdF (DUF218 family)